MKIAIIAAGLALAGGFGAVAPAEAQYYGHHGGYHSTHGGFDRGYRSGGYGYRDRGYGPGHGYGAGYGGGYRRGRLVCTYRHGLRRCFHA
ncbi:hypothetical protein [Sphingomonas bacterium]|uniref:hypothetical protein n=1 Tax=Sphingomonas bacterium TaxID=1895847 RepID=UPI0015774107|nr:hypothetical protein [Sphingomonas bacterium]